jgi:FkbM family methyltransferase
MEIEKGVIHIGANVGQERNEYKDLNVLWIEPIPDIFNILSDNIKSYPKQTALNYLISDKDDHLFDFYVSSQHVRSSMLEFTNHHFKDKGFEHTESLKLKSIRMDTLIDKHNINLNDYDVLVTDCQGADYQVLKSFGSYIKHFKYVKSEVMISEIYKGIILEDEINKYMSDCGFSLISDNEYVWNSTQRDNIYKNND